MGSPPKLGWMLVAGFVGVFASSSLRHAACATEDLYTETLEVLEGRGLSGEQVAARERLLDGDPEDVAARAGLLGYYWSHRRTEQDAHAEHLLWFIENAPESPALQGPWGAISAERNPEGYNQAKAAWLQQIREAPLSVAVLRPAADFFRWTDAEFSAELLERGEALEPSSPHWAQQLGFLRWHDAYDPIEGSDAAGVSRALADFERAHQLADAQGGGYLLTELGKTAFVAGDLDKARHYAEQMLEDLPRPTWDSDGWDAGNRVHYANLILGRIALAEGDLAKAGVHLIAAGQTQGSPQLNSFGPDMALAKRLLDRGAAQTVTAYLELCLDFWESGQDELKDWIVLIEAGRTPDFSSNLRF